MGLHVTAGTVCHIGESLYRTFAQRQMPDNLSVFSDMAVMVWLDARRCPMSEIVGQAVNVLLSSVYLCTVTGSVNWMLALYHCAIVGPMISLAISLMGQLQWFVSLAASCLCCKCSLYLRTDLSAGSSSGVKSAAGPR